MSNILTGFNMQGNDPIDNRIVSPSKFETLEEYLQRVPIQKRYYGLSFYALDENNELRHYTFQTSLIEPTIDDDEEEIERLDKELQEHVNNKEIHKTSEEIRSEIVDADIPDTIARVQWTLDKIEEAVNTVMGNIVDGASDEYNTLKKIQDKIVELRSEMESQLYGDDGGEVLKTLEQALKFLNQYKDFIVDIPDNYVNKQDIVDNLNTDDPTKVLSARQGKVLSETLTNYFDSAMASIRAETNRATNAENRIEDKLDSEIDRSTAEDIRIQSELDAEEARAQSEEQRIEDKLDAEIERSTTKDTELGNQIIAETNRAKGEEQRIETKLDNEITRSTAKDADHDSRIEALEGETHVQNTDIGTTSQTFQLQMGKPGNKIKNEDAAISVRNADDSDYVNFIAKNATFKGDLIVEGQSFVTEAETVEIKDNILLLNKGEAGSGVTKGIAGLQIDRGTEPDFQILFVESDRRFKAGEEGNLQCLALRDDDGNMLDGMFTTWDSATHRLKTTNLIPSTRKLFFNTSTNSLGFASHVYDSSYSAESFTFTNALGSLFFSAGESNLNLDTDKTYFRFYKNLMILSSIISSRTSVSLLNNSGATIATFGSPSTINSSLYVANQVIIKGGSDTKLIMQSADADNFNLIESQNSSGTVLSKLGYYGTFWGIDDKKIATEEFANNKFLPLAGGTMTGHIILSNTKALYGKSKEGNDFNIAFISDSNTLTLGSSLTTHISSSASDLIHLRNGTYYKIWDAYNLTSPLLYASGTAATSTIVYNRNLGVNGSQWTFLSATNAATTSIYAPTTTGTSGQVLTSTGGVPTWSNISNVGDSRYVKKDGDTMTGNLSLPYLTSTQPVSGWTSKKVPNDYKPKSFYLEDDYNGGSGISNYGTVVTFSGRSAHWVSQMRFAGGDSTRLAVRTCNYDSESETLREFTDWEILATQEFVSSKCAQYLPLSGGTLTGKLTINTALVNPLVINDTNANASEVYIQIQRAGTALAAIGNMPSNGSYIYNYATAKYLFVGSDGAYFGTSSSTTKLLTSADLSSYATQSWCNSNFASLSRFTATGSYSTIISGGNEMCIGNSVQTTAAADFIVNYRVPTGCTYAPTNFVFRAGSSTTWANIYAGNLYMSNNLVATQSWVNSQGFLKSVSGYLPLTGGTMSGSITIPGNTGQSLIVTANESSNYVNAVVYKKRNTPHAAMMGYHSTGGTNEGTGAIILVPYPTNTNAWAKTVGLYIAKNELLLDGNAVATQTWASGQFPTKTGTGASGTWGISISGNATTATTASKLGSTTIGGSAKPIYLSSGTPTACSATVGSTTVPVYMNAGTITQCSTTLGVSITGNAATATTASNSNNLGGVAAATYVKSTSSTKVSDIQVVTTAGSTTGVLYVVLES